MSRKLSEKCKTCNDMNSAMSVCFRECSIPLDILKDVEQGRIITKEKFRKAIEEGKIVIKNEESFE